MATDARISARFTSFLAAGVLSLYSLSSVAQPEDPAQAQQSEATPPAADAPAASPTTAVVQDAKIDQFADAYVQVQGIQEQASQQLSSTSDAEAANEVKANAEAQMIQAVERSGLKVEEFNEIVQAMVADADLRSKVVSKIEQRRRT